MSTEPDEAEREALRAARTAPAAGDLDEALSAILKRYRQAGNSPDMRRNLETWIEDIVGGVPFLLALVESLREHRRRAEDRAERAEAALTEAAAVEKARIAQVAEDLDAHYHDGGKPASFAALLRPAQARKGDTMSSITLARSTSTHRVPGVDVEAVSNLACMHDPTVRQWITAHRGFGGVVLIADDEWVNPGDGTESLTFPADKRDVATLAAIRREANDEV